MRARSWVMPRHQRVQRRARAGEQSGTPPRAPPATACTRSAAPSFPSTRSARKGLRPAVWDKRPSRGRACRRGRQLQAHAAHTERPRRPAGELESGLDAPARWKRLDLVGLRLESRGKPVGRIALDQQTPRPRASGPAAHVVAGRSTLAAAGKRLRPAHAPNRKRYAARTLVAKLAARDDDGTGQGWRKARRLRVLSD
jgi:hypothetical protein